MHVYDINTNYVCRLWNFRVSTWTVVPVNVFEHTPCVYLISLHTRRALTQYSVIPHGWKLDDIFCCKTSAVPANLDASGFREYRGHAYTYGMSFYCRNTRDNVMCISAGFRHGRSDRWTVTNSLIYLPGCVMSFSL